MFVITVTVLGIVIYRQSEIIKQKDDTINDHIVRYNTVVNSMQNKINEQEQEKFKIIQDAQEYFRGRFEKLEEESRKNFREVKQIKNTN